MEARSVKIWCSHAIRTAWRGRSGCSRTSSAADVAPNTAQARCRAAASLEDSRPRPTGRAGDRRLFAARGAQPHLVRGRGDRRSRARRRPRRVPPRAAYTRRCRGRRRRPQAPRAPDASAARPAPGARDRALRSVLSVGPRRDLVRRCQGPRRSASADTAVLRGRGDGRYEALSGSPLPLRRGRGCLPRRGFGRACALSRSFSAWLLRIARNAALDHLRHRRAVPSNELVGRRFAAGAEPVEGAEPRRRHRPRKVSARSPGRCPQFGLLPRKRRGRPPSHPPYPAPAADRATGNRPPKPRRRQRVDAVLLPARHRAVIARPHDRGTQPKEAVMSHQVAPSVRRSSSVRTTGSCGLCSRSRWSPSSASPPPW